jgi:hypothetical protein
LAGANGQNEGRLPGVEIQGVSISEFFRIRKWISASFGRCPAVQGPEPFGGDRQAYVFDLFGNRLELLEPL